MDVRNDSVTSTETTDATETSAVVLPSSTDGIQLPEGFDLTGSVFDRVGDDLLLIDTGGTKVVVRDYLDGDAGDLIGAGGARVSGEMAAKLAGPLAPGQYAQSGTLASAEPIGHVETVGGTVTATHADGTHAELSAGDPVYQGDILESAADGGVGIVLADETTFSMGAEGRMVLDEMVYDPGAQEGSLAISVLQGVFTFVSGQVAKADPDAMVLETPVATIGIRGTQAGIDIADGQNLTIVNMEGSNSFVGEIVITTAAGVEILNLTNQGTSVAGLGAAPTATSIFDLSEIVGRFSGTLGYLPTNSGTGTGNSYGVEPLGQAPGGPADGIDELDDTLNLDSFDTAAGGAEEAAGQPIVEDVIPVVAGAPLVSGGPLPTIDLDIPAGGPSITGGSTTPVDGPQSETPIVGGTVPAQNEPVVVADGSIRIGNGDLIAPDAEDNLTVVGGDGANTIVTGQGDDVIVANGGDDSVNAGAGDDQVIGGSGEGDDVYVGGDGEDTLVYSSAEEGVYVDLFAGKASSIGYPTFDEIGQDQFTGFENVIGGDGDDLIFGDKGDNRLQGGAGDDVLRGGYGTDTIEGGAGDDLILADEDGDGGDGFFGENGDVYDGGDGNDTVSYAGAEDSVWAILGWDDEEWEGGEGGEEGGFAWGEGSGADFLVDIENVIGGDGDDGLGGDDGANRLAGGEGEDDLWGADGDDTLLGSDGDDDLEGGRGDDTLTGGDGEDYFIMYEGDGNDTITDFSDEDTLVFEDWFGQGEIEVSIVEGEGGGFDKIVADYGNGDVAEITLEGHQGGSYSVSDDDWGVSVTLDEERVQIT